MFKKAGKPWANKLTGQGSGFRRSDGESPSSKEGRVLPFCR